MAVNEKYNADKEDVPDGTLIQIIPGKLSVIFYPKKSQPSFTDILKDLGGKGTIVLVTSNPEKRVESTVRDAVCVAKDPYIKNPIILIEYINEKEKKDILNGIIEGLGLKGNLRK